MKQVFFIGNKRSGTSLMVQMLNMHPDVYVMPEADIMWILYQMGANTGYFTSHNEDNPQGMFQTLHLYYDPMMEILRGNKDKALGSFVIRLGSAPDVLEQWLDTSDNRVVQAFYGCVAYHVMNVKRGWPLIVGDKKPAQHCDPILREFVYGALPDAKYIHLVRHPQAVVGSMKALAERYGGVPDNWKCNDQGLLARWVIHERWAREMADDHRFDVLNVRFEDLLTTPNFEFERILRHIDAPCTTSVINKAAGFVAEGQNAKYADVSLGYGDDALELMELYKYA